MPTDPDQNFEKIHKSPSTKWIRMGTAARGVGYDLLRACDRATGFCSDSLNSADIAVRLQALEGEEGLIEYGVRRLLCGGFLVVHKGCLYITHHFKRSHSKEEFEEAVKATERLARNFPNSTNSSNSQNFAPPSSTNSQNSTPRERSGIAEESDQTRKTSPPDDLARALQIPNRGEEREDHLSDATHPRRVSATGKQSKSKPKPDAADVRSVFEFWKADTEHDRAKPLAKRKARIRARLREGFSAEQLIEAIRNRRHDPWLMGENPSGKVYDGLETLLRDGEKVEDLLTLPERKRQHERGSEDPVWAAKRDRVMRATEERERREAEARRSRAQQKPPTPGAPATDSAFQNSDEPGQGSGPKSAPQGGSAQILDLTKHIGLGGKPA